MSNNVELYLKVDNKESFSNESNNSDSNDNEFETEEEKKNKISIQNALKSKNNERVFEIINSKISSFCSKLKILQDYSLCLGSKLDNKQKGEDIEKIILETGDEISQAFDLIEIVKNFDYNDKKQKIQNIQQANSLEDKCKTYKEKFDNLTNEIKKQNLNLIKQARNTRRFSNFSDFSGEIHLDNDSPKKKNSEQNNSIEYESDKNIVENIEVKKKQNKAIKKIARKMERSLSRRQTMAKLNSNATENNNDDDGMEIFNIDINYKKMNELKEGDSKDFSNVSLSKKDSTIFHDMEKRVYIALEGQNQSFIKKYWIFILIFIFIIILVLYFVFFRGGK
jgi:hypothetical protein